MMNRRKITLNQQPPVITHSPAETHQWGRQFAKSLVPGTVVALYGELGAGKTHLTQGICAAFNVTEPVTSPTFTLINEYQGDLPIYHFDCYRIHSTWELIDMGAEEYFEGEGICLVEWAERVADILPPDTQHIRLEYI
ncbi:MAG: tRNA (adenosine(37)-N6)-threonylcarbamoyltransferase complex ATPase subunit type 1 TsaE [Gemmatimonadetes bacterium]|nr:MAG: tRNA (adenosine(37)-N6)-threonylcarbamoyltransferase complex ATPase subunit type 1 TsaE [Gemmatimonadota bacterium]